MKTETAKSETPELSREEIEEAVRDCIRDQEIAFARGDFSAGRWHYARAWFEDGTINITTGVEASPCYPESEYYGKGSHPPVTFYTQQSCYSPSADDGLEWVISDWKDGNYIGEIDPKYPSCFLSNEYFCIDRLDEVAEKIGLDIDGKTDDEIHTVFESAGWKPFILGDPVEEPDIEDMVETAVNDICEKWGIE